MEILESVARLWKRVFGEAHPETQQVQTALKDARVALLARGTPSSGGAEVLQTADDLAACFG